MQGENQFAGWHAIWRHHVANHPTLRNLEARPRGVSPLYAAHSLNIEVSARIPSCFFKVLVGFLQLLLLSTYFTIDLIELNCTYKLLYMRRTMSIYLMWFKAGKGAMKLRDYVFTTAWEIVENRNIFVERFHLRNFEVLDSYMRDAKGSNASNCLESKFS